MSKTAIKLQFASVRAESQLKGWRSILQIQVSNIENHSAQLRIRAIFNLNRRNLFRNNIAVLLTKISFSLGVRGSRNGCNIVGYESVHQDEKMMQSDILCPETPRFSPGILFCL